MFVDSHAHLDGEEFRADLDEVIDRARAAGVRAILNIGTGDPHSGSLERAVEVAQRYEGVYCAIGVHPHDARLFDRRAEERLNSLLGGRGSIVALGEIGLDYHYDNSPHGVQRDCFARQLQMAREADLPVIIHSRDAERDTIDILRAEWDAAAGTRRRGGVMHCFSGSYEMAISALEMNYMISFAGNLTFKNGGPLREVARRLPLERVLVETDCPYLTPVPFRGRRNEPARVVETARCLAELHNLDVGALGRRTSENFARLFNLDIAGAGAEAVGE